MPARKKKVTDRALRYRAQAAVTGPHACAICGRKGKPGRGPDGLDVMHLSGFEEDTSKANLAYGCRRCNAGLAAAFKAIGAGRLTKQFNPSKGVPTFQQYAWAVSNHRRGADDEGGAIIHATPKHKRVEYAKRIAGVKRERGTDSSLPDWLRENPGPPGEAFKRCVRSVRAKGSADDPKAVCAAAGREKYGKEAFQKMAAAGKRRAARANPSSSFGKGFEYGRKKLRGASQERMERTADDFIKRSAYWGASIPYERGEFLRGLMAWDEQYREARRRNPADASAKVFEEFHGYPPDEEITVQKKIHFHKHLSAAGELVGLAVKPKNKRIPEQHIEDLGGAFLAFNEDKNQLFIEGGNQYLSKHDLNALGIESPHEIETLGKLIAVGYYTNKTHLGDDGGEAVYDHVFRTTNENGRHVVVELARYPDLIYRVRDEQFEISGGSYIIRAEGIDK